MEGNAVSFESELESTEIYDLLILKWHKSSYEVGPVLGTLFESSIKYLHVFLICFCGFLDLISNIFTKENQPKYSSE